MNLDTKNDSPNQVIGLFDNYTDAEHAIRDLKEAGVPADRIGIGMGTDGTEAQSGNETRHEGLWRKIADFFEGKDHSGDASRDNSQSEAGSTHVLVSISVLTPEQRIECEEILEEHNAHLEPNVNQNLGGKADGVESGQRIQLLSEVLRVQKERVSKGEVRLRKEVVTENQTIDVPVTREELVIDRTPVQSATPASGAIGSNQEIRVPLSQEKVRVDKTPIVKEEVRVGKKKVQESRQVNEQVKREELHVDRKDETGVQPPNKRNIA